MNRTTKTRATSPAQLSVLLILILTISGCLGGTIDPADLNLEDNSSTTYTLRITKALTNRHFLEFDHEKSRGNSEVDVRPNDYFSFDDYVLPLTSAKIDVDFALKTSALVWGMQTKQKDQLHGKFFCGIRRTTLKMEISEAGYRYRLKDSSYGATGGIELYLPEVIKGLRFGFRLTVSFLPRGSEASSLYYRVSANYQPTTWFDIFAGWRKWGYVNNGHDSEIDIDLSGPALGVNLLF